MTVIVVIIVFVFSIFMLVRYLATRGRRAREWSEQRFQWLAARFGPDAASRIIRREVWQGQTQEMLLEARGRPQAVDRKLLRTKTVETWKYNMQGRNRYSTRITVENGVVIGWDAKG